MKPKNNWKAATHRLLDALKQSRIRQRQLHAEMNAFIAKRLRERSPSPQPH